MLLAPSAAGQTAAPRPAAAFTPPLRRRRLAARRGRVCVPRCTGDAPPPRPGATTHSPARSKCSPLLESALLSPGGNEPAVDEWKAVPDIWRTAAQKYPDSVALVDPYHDPPSELTYKQLEQQILDFSHGLRAVGVAPDEKLALFADNSCRWLVADQGIMATGAINVVRGTKSSDEELFQIYNHSESIALVVDSPQFFNRLAETFISRVNARFIVLLWGDKSSLNSKAVMDIPVYDYNDITELGRENRNALCYSSEQGRQGVFEAITSEDVATLIYTSGTSGTPKGVMLTHRNLLHQINNMWEIVPAVPGDRFLSMLPPWHAYERSAEYFILTHGTQQIYSSVKYLMADLQKYQPHYVFSVPLVYETLYSSIQRQISSSSPARKNVALALIKISLLYMEAKKIFEGTVLSNNPVKPSSISYMFKCVWARIVAALLWPLHNLAKMFVYKKIHSTIGISKAAISGGGSLPMHVDKFFEAIGIKVQNGYGLTETSPAVAARRPFCNVLGTVGHPIKHTEIKIVDIETGEVLPDGSKGIVKIKGLPVMKGYYKNPSATNKALDQEGWFNTGDIGWIAPHHATGPSRKCGGMLVLEGRAKDTIVLTTGENVEPAELEEAASRSSLIDQIMVIGQDRRRLGAIIVPNNDEVLAAAKRKSSLDGNNGLAKDTVMSLLYAELRTWMAGCSFQIGPILVVDEPFTELTRRHVIAQCYTSGSMPRISETEATLSQTSEAVQGRTAPLVQALKSTAAQDVSCFHFPGHNRGKAAPSLLSNLIGAGAFLHDLPELPELDDLFYPKGVILDAQNRAAELFGSSKTWFLVNGSTCGIQAAVMATCSPGDYIIIPRNCHISVISALVLSGAVPKYIVPEYSSVWDIAGGVTPSQVHKALKELQKDGKKVGAVLVTSPTYHGICSDVQGIVDVCHPLHIPVIVDEAHGAHFKFHDSFPSTAIEQGADLAVQSTHKVLSSLTQSSMLHMAGGLVDADKVSQCLQLLQSSSPSYLLLSSLDAARAQLSEKGKYFDDSVAMALETKDQLRVIPGISVLDLSSFISDFPAIDPLRITLSASDLHLSGYEADDIFAEEHQIVSELVGTQAVTFAVNLGTSSQDVENLVQCAKHLSVKYFSSKESRLRKHNYVRSPLDKFSVKLTPREAFFTKTRRVCIEDSLGEICGELICPYPPGIPVLIPGEVVTWDSLSYLINVRDQGMTISGAADSELNSIMVCNL